MRRDSINSQAEDCCLGALGGKRADMAPFCRRVMRFVSFSSTSCTHKKCLEHSICQNANHPSKFAYLDKLRGIFPRDIQACMNSGAKDLMRGFDSRTSCAELPYGAAMLPVNANLAIFRVRRSRLDCSDAAQSNESAVWGGMWVAPHTQATLTSRSDTTPFSNIEEIVVGTQNRPPRSNSMSLTTVTLDDPSELKAQTITLTELSSAAP